MDHRAFLTGLSPETRRRMTERSDARGLWHLGLHVGLGLALATPIALQAPFWPVFLMPLGVVLAFLFTLQHECTHQTPFRSRWINEFVGHASGLILLQPFLWFRAFHMAHHRYTNDPENDPELAGPRPDRAASLLWYLSTLGYWRDKVMTLWQIGFRPIAAPYLPSGSHAKLRREARLYLCGYAAALISLIWSPLLLWVWLIPLALGFPVLRLYLLAEHDRCPHVPNMFANSRTTLTTRAIRFLAWNMPYHAEHHAWPMVPFHALPALHRLTRPHLETVTDGYTRFTRDTVDHLRP